MLRPKKEKLQVWHEECSNTNEDMCFWDEDFAVLECLVTIDFVTTAYILQLLIQRSNSFGALCQKSWLWKQKLSRLRETERFRWKCCFKKIEIDSKQMFKLTPTQIFSKSLNKKQNILKENSLFNQSLRTNTIFSSSENRQRWVGIVKEFWTSKPALHSTATSSQLRRTAPNGMDSNVAAHLVSGSDVSYLLNLFSWVAIDERLWLKTVIKQNAMWLTEVQRLAFISIHNHTFLNNGSLRWFWAATTLRTTDPSGKEYSIKVSFLNLKCIPILL